LTDRRVLLTVDAGAEYQPLEAVLDQSAATEVIESMRRERECLVATANQNLEAYRAEARKREEALEAYRTAARERDETLAVAAENLKAYRAEAREREEALAVAAENLEAYRIAAQERDQESAVARASLKAYQTIDRQYHQLTRRLRWFPLSLLIPRA
jgi:ABC-type Na+ efflux pump permease subunit